VRNFRASSPSRLGPLHPSCAIRVTPTPLPLAQCPHGINSGHNGAGSRQNHLSLYSQLMMVISLMLRADRDRLMEPELPKRESICPPPIFSDACDMIPRTRVCVEDTKNGGSTANHDWRACRKRSTPGCSRRVCQVMLAAYAMTRGLVPPR
jgi:hypothetical protein